MYDTRGVDLRPSKGKLQNTLALKENNRFQRINHGRWMEHYLLWNLYPDVCVLGERRMQTPLH